MNSKLRTSYGKNALYMAKLLARRPPLLGNLTRPRGAHGVSCRYHGLTISWNWKIVAKQEFWTWGLGGAGVLALVACDLCKFDGYFAIWLLGGLGVVLD